MKKGKIREHLGYAELTAFTKQECYFHYICSITKIDYNMKRYLLRTSRQKSKYFKNAVI